MTLINDEDMLYTKDELAFRDVAREFVEREIVPIANKVETKAPLSGVFGGKYFYEVLSYMKCRHFPS